MIKGLKIKTRKFWKKYTGKAMIGGLFAPSHQFCNFSLQVIKQSFSWKRFVVASKAWLQIFSEKVSKILPGDKVGKDYDSVWNFLPNFKTLKILQIWTFWPSSHKDLLPANFTKVLSLRILADGICL